MPTTAKDCFHHLADLLDNSSALFRWPELRTLAEIAGDLPLTLAELRDALLFLGEQPPDEDPMRFGERRGSCVDFGVLLATHDAGEGQGPRQAISTTAVAVWLRLANHTWSEPPLELRREALELVNATGLLVDFAVREVGEGDSLDAALALEARCSFALRFTDGWGVPLSWVPQGIATVLGALLQLLKVRRLTCASDAVLAESNIGHVAGLGGWVEVSPGRGQRCQVVLCDPTPEEGRLCVRLTAEAAHRFAGFLLAVLGYRYAVDGGDGYYLTNEDGDGGDDA
jgi:hypothetical protein